MVARKWCIRIQFWRCFSQGSVRNCPKQQVRNLRQFDEENEMFHDSFIIPCKVQTTWTQINHPGRNFCGARLSGVHFIYHMDENILLWVVYSFYLLFHKVMLRSVNFSTCIDKHINYNTSTPRSIIKLDWTRSRFLDRLFTIHSRHLAPAIH